MTELSQTDARTERAAHDAEPTAPRGVIRLLRSGLLTPERAERVRRLHADAVEGHLPAKKD